MSVFPNRFPNGKPAGLFDPNRKPVVIPISDPDAPSRYVRGVPMDQMNRRERFFWRRARWVQWLLIRLPPFRNVRPLRTKIVFDRIVMPVIKEKS